MKKLLSLIIALFFVISELSVLSVALYDETDCLSVSKFTSAFVEMVSETEDKVNEGVVAENADVYFSSGSTSVENQDVNEEVTDENTEKTYRLIVKSSFELDPLDSVGYVFGYNDLHILQFDNKSSFEKAYDFYDSLQCVEYVEEDLCLTEAVVDDGNDIVYESAIEYPTITQSNMYGYATAKNKSHGNTVSIGVVDSGVQHDHEFLNGRVVDTGFNSISDNGTAYDDRGHGTHVAGIIVANTLSNVTVHAYKALNESGSGTSAQVSLAIDAAIEDGMDIINLSVQMKGFSDTLHEAVQRAYNAGITVVAAAGNAGVDIAQTQYSPGCFDEVISVMSCTMYRRISDFSNYGTPCDFAAPGENVLSAYLDNTYKYTSGTSMASPFICAAVAYEFAKDDTLTPEQVRVKLEEKSQFCYGNPAGKCVYPDVKSSFEGMSSAPVFLYESCNFAGSLLVSLSCNSEDVDILYSFDGERFLEYTEPFYITETKNISAFARSETLETSFTRLANSRRSN